MLSSYLDKEDALKLLTYNTCYCMGFRGARSSMWTQAWRYLYAGDETFKRLAGFVEELNPDIATLIETDSGSLRSRFINQPQTLSERLGFKTAAYAVKYGDSLKGALPTFRHQCNAVLTKSSSAFRMVNLKCGEKRLVVQVTDSNLNLFAVHLSLNVKDRARQIEEIAQLVKYWEGFDTVVTGDFNVFTGLQELDPLTKGCGLWSPNTEHVPTYPTWSPRHEIDFFLVSNGIKVKKFEVLKTDISDHLPIVLDIDA